MVLPAMHVRHQNQVGQVVGRAEESCNVINFLSEHPVKTHAYLKLLSAVSISSEKYPEDNISEKYLKFA